MMATGVWIKSVLSGLVLSVSVWGSYSLTIPFGAREDAMGGTGVALSSYGSAAFYNPAGIAGVTEGQRGKSVYFYVGSFGQNNLKECLQENLQLDKYPTLGSFSLWYNRMGTFSEYHDELVGFGWGKNFINQSNVISAGAAVKFGTDQTPEIEETSFDGSNIVKTGRKTNFSSYCVALDIGVIEKTPWGFNIGTSLKNIGPKEFSFTSDELVKKEIESRPLPFTLMWSIAYERCLSAQTLRILDIATEYNLKSIISPVYRNEFMTEGEGIRHSLGIELRFLNTLSIRSGINDIFDERELKFSPKKQSTYGIGVKLFNSFQLDYARMIKETQGEFSNLPGPKIYNWSLNLTLSDILNLKSTDLQWYRSDTPTHKRLHSRPTPIANFGFHESPVIFPASADSTTKPDTTVIAAPDSTDN